MSSTVSVPSEMPESSTAADAGVAGVGEAPVVVRSAADRRMRALLRLPVDAPRESIFGAESAFGKSIAISAVRCLITYVFLPLLAPILKLSGTLGPLLGLALGVVSMVSITFSMRRFFAADHKYRWHYAAVGGAIFVALVWAGIFDIVMLSE